MADTVECDRGGRQGERDEGAVPHRRSIGGEEQGEVVKAPHGQCREGLEQQKDRDVAGISLSCSPRSVATVAATEPRPPEPGWPKIGSCSFLRLEREPGNAYDANAITVRYIVWLSPKGKLETRGSGNLVLYYSHFPHILTVSKRHK